MREPGSGTRSEFEQALKMKGVEPPRPALELPSNEAVLSAVSAGGLAAAISELAAGPMLKAGLLNAVPLDLPERPFSLLRHAQRRPSRAAAALLERLD
jgi:DNA-binding transcriptional LysR family regulator